MKAHLHFDEGLNYFVGSRLIRVIDLKDHPQLKDAIESCGVPHGEVGAVVVNGALALLNQQLHPGDAVQIFSPAPNRPLSPKFMVDCNLGKLNTLLRTLGFDSHFENDIADDRAIQISNDDERILLTKDRRMLMRKVVRRGYLVKAVLPKDQIHEVLKRFLLHDEVQLLTRCIDCNIVTQPIAKALILDRLEPLTKQYYHHFKICPRCQKIFWRGTHFEKIREWFHHEIVPG